MKKILKQLEQSRVKQLLFFMFCMVLLLIIYIPCFVGVKNHVERKQINELSITSDYDVLHEVKFYQSKEKKVGLYGWVFRLNSIMKNINVVLQEYGSNEIRYMDVECYEGGEYSNFYSPEDFGKINFNAEIKETEENTCYEIVFVITYQEKDSSESEVELTKKISSGSYLYNGAVYNYDPLKYKAPLITSGKYSEIINNGVLKGFDLDKGIWIYRFEDELFYFTNVYADSVGIPVMPYTSKLELLPKERRQYGVDHLGFFVGEKIIDEKTGNMYQVVSVKLPTEYPITYISTGLFDSNSSTWVRKFMIPMVEWRNEKYE